MRILPYNGIFSDCFILLCVGGKAGGSLLGCIVITLNQADNNGYQCGYKDNCSENSGQMTPYACNDVHKKSFLLLLRRGCCVLSILIIRLQKESFQTIQVFASQSILSPCLKVGGTLVVIT